MYKLSEVAKKLNVEKVLLFEMLLTKGEYLVGNVVKKHGVTYLSDDGIEIIGKIIRGEDIEYLISDIEKADDFESDPNEKNSQTNMDVVEENFESLEDLEKNTEEDEDLKNDDSLEFEGLGKEQIQLNSISDNEKNNEKNSEVKDLEILTGKSKFSKFEKEEKRNRISKLRNEFLALDSEIRKKQEAIESYDKILEEDIQWVCILEDKLSAKLKEKFSDEDKDVYQKKIREKIFFKK